MGCRCGSGATARTAHPGPQPAYGGGALLGAPRVYDSVDELLRKGCAPHLALICSASWDHAGHASALLRAGVDVLVEPPLAEDPGEADRVAELAERIEVRI